MDKQEVELVNAIIQSKPWLRLTNEIDEGADKTFHEGKIEIDTAKGVLKLDVRITPDFPLSKIEFICTSHKGIDHEMLNGLLCLNAAPAKELKDRLELELEKLQWWTDKYFVKEEKDDHFEYYQFHRQSNIQMLFEEDQEKPLPKSRQGRFSYGSLNELKIGEKVYHAWIAGDIGGRKSRWSKFYQQMSDGPFKGLWLLLSGPPIIQGRQTIEKWEDLLKLLTPTQTQFIYDEHKKIKGNSSYENFFLILVGYEIEEKNGKELHWDMIQVPYADFPYSSQKVGPGKYGPLDLGKEVSWCKTSNASYQRLFGRGKLSNKLTEGKILIAGTGAIGSSLFLALVRGGCKEIEISDFDDIDPGNICRGQFSFKESHKPKISELYNEAHAISPYVNVNIGFGVIAIRQSNKVYPALKKKLMRFDYIFDCTTDKYLSIMLDEMALRGQIINLSISDKANQFVVITGNGNIHTTKSNLYDRISRGKAETFFVATGCWHPTFQANYAEINAGLMYALNEINQKLETGEGIRSFFISKTLNATKSLTYEISYNV
ncbi:MAG: ThiF family adenylyltransferase [Chitinophagaceae bacterium]